MCVCVCGALRDVQIITIYLYTIIIGRSARIRGSLRSHLGAIAHQAVLAGLDWVFYANRDYCVVSVIPDCKLQNVIQILSSHYFSLL